MGSKRSTSERNGLVESSVPQVATNVATRDSKLVVLQLSALKIDALGLSKLAFVRFVLIRNTPHLSLLFGRCRSEFQNKIMAVLLAMIRLR